MPTFQDSENKVFTLIPDGDAIFTVAGFECGISNGGKTNGSDLYEVEFIFEAYPGCSLTEKLIDHDSTAWKIDTFLKSAGIKLAKGAAFEFRADKAAARGVPWINPLGLRGWCKVGHRLWTEKGTNKPMISTSTGKQGASNIIHTFYVDKPKIERVEIVDETTPF